MEDLCHFSPHCQVKPRSLLTHAPKELDLRERHGTPFAYEREEEACVRVLLAKKQPNLALQRLEPVLERATVGNGDT